jgi:hypothetical protein
MCGRDLADLAVVALNCAIGDHHRRERDLPALHHAAQGRERRMRAALRLLGISARTIWRAVVLRPRSSPLGSAAGVVRDGGGAAHQCAPPGRVSHAAAASCSPGTVLAVALSRSCIGAALAAPGSRAAPLSLGR